MIMKRPTIQQIAALSGVSRGTVDRVVHDRPNVNPEKAKRVRDAMRRLNYRPRRSRRAGQTIRLGVVIPHHADAFGLALAGAVESAAAEYRAAGMEILLNRPNSPLPMDMADAVSALVDKGAAGLAVWTGGGPAVGDAVRSAADKGVRVVTFAHDIPDCGQVSHVGQDWERSGRIAAGLMARMLRPGEGVLILAGNVESTPGRGRVRGFSEFWTGLGRLQDECRVDQCYDSFDVAYEKTCAALVGDERLCGVYMAGEGTPACVEAVGRLALPRRIRVVAHDLTVEHRRLLQYGAVDFVIHQDVSFLARRPLEILASLMNGRGRDVAAVEYAPMDIATAESI
ncbi:MAG: LacI family DNA-binding transcriptional regulator [Planctomycetaceae bacterium]|nr:LacI family DNA-binding transcriptional regulator [Planctomycetaceae bacterium]